MGEPQGRAKRVTRANGVLTSGRGARVVASTHPVPGVSRPASAAARAAAAARTSAGARGTRSVRGAAVAGRASTLDPIITMDVHGTIQSASEDIEPLFGWTPAELCGQNVNTLIPEPRRSALDRYLDRYRNPGRSKMLERVRRFDAMRKNGTVVPIELSVSRADLPGDLGPYFVGLIRDMSGAMDVDADTPEARTRLQKFVTEQTRALATAHLRLQLSDRLASLGALAAGLGHDLNNVLLPLRARLNAIEHTGVSEAALEHLQEVRHALIYLQHLSDGLHLLSLDPRGEGDAAEIAAPTDLASWWEQVGGLLRTAVPKTTRLTATVPSGLPPVALAPHWLTQAVLNIVVNAGEAIALGRKSGRKSGRIIISAFVEARDKMVRLTIKDNGRGMTRAVQKHAMDPFFTTKPRTLGTGLGLPLARKVVERVGGRLEIRSTEGKGTTMLLVLPSWRGGGGSASWRGTLTRTAVVTLAKRDEATLVAHILAAAGFGVVAAKAPGRADVWVTAPSAGALTRATRWTRGGGGRRVIVLGAIDAAARRGWGELGAMLVPDGRNYLAIRGAIASVAKDMRGSGAKGETDGAGAGDKQVGRRGGARVGGARVGGGRVGERAGGRGVRARA